jgi:predicted naringenin-chalcone synthase
LRDLREQTINRLIKFQQDNEISDAIVKLGGKHFVDEIKSSESFFDNLGVSNRNILCTPEDPMTWWMHNSGTDIIALQGAIAYEQLMKSKEPLNGEDRLILVANVTDSTAPNIGYSVLSHLQKRHENFTVPSVIALTGEGCSGFISGLREADIYLSKNPHARVIVLTVEMMATPLLNPWLQNQLISYASTISSDQAAALSRRLLGLAIQRYLFGEGCAAALCSNEHNGLNFKHFYKWANLDPEDIHLLEVIGSNTKALPHLPPFGFFYQQPHKLLNRLSEAYLPAASLVLSTLTLSNYDVAIHTGSKKILDCVQSALELTESQVTKSRYVLNNYGNMNATTGATILSHLMENKNNKPILALFFGLGFALQLAY